MTIPAVLVVDDEVKLCRNIALKLKREGFTVLEAHNGKSALRKLQQHPVHVMILDYMLTDMTGLEVLKKTKEISPRSVVYMLTAYGNIENAVLAMKWGAADYFNKPIDLKRLANVVSRTFEALTEESAEVVFESAKMQEIRRLLDRVAKTDASIMLQGENGVGKTTIAKWIHYQSLRKQNPFVGLNCASMPELLLEQQLFGESSKADAADGGTLFLGEIGDMSLHLQAKLLQLLEERRYHSSFDNQYHDVDLRLITATSKPLKSMVKEGRFRDDLFYRVNLVELDIPPLRDRTEDIEPLAQQKLDKLNAKYGKLLTMTEGLVGKLSSLPWQGNIRELFNIIERMQLLKDNGALDVPDLPRFLVDSSPESPAQSGRLHGAIEEMEEKLIRDALRQTRGNQSKAAALLGISRNALIYKIKRFKQ